MAVPAVELRPRGSVAVLDAALRLCARRSEVWALALPGGALVAFALTAWAEAVRTRDGLWLATLGVTVAWFLRALFQGATCHWVEGLLISPEVPAPRASLKAALQHAPTLFITTAVLLGANLIMVPASLGLVVFFLSSHIAAYAVAMKEAGHPLAIHVTSSQVLGPAREATTGLRAMLGLQLLLALNVHIAANAFIYLGRKLLGLELTFLQRYAAFDNPQWLLAVAAFTFALFEPIRAAVAAILVVDGRVRQDGVDLETAIGQLPPVRRSSSAGRAAGLLLALALGAAAPSAWAQGGPEVIPSADLEPRLHEAAIACGLDSPRLTEQLEAVEAIAAAERPSLQRFVHEVEALAYEEEDCGAVEQRLDSGLPLVAETRELLARQRDAPSAQQAAKEILARPEFVNAPAAAKRDEKAVEEPEEARPEAGWWERFKRWLRAKLEEWLRPEPRDFRPPPMTGSGTAFAQLIVGALVVAVAIALVWLVLRFRERSRGHTQVEVEVVSTGEVASGEQLGALARAPEGWAHLADTLAARGELREAIRHLFLAVLSRLHREGVIDYDPGLSNWDYLRRFRGPEAWRSAYRELTFRFDYAFYGHTALEPEAYARFRTVAEPILAAPPSQRKTG